MYVVRHIMTGIAIGAVMALVGCVNQVISSDLSQRLAIQTVDVNVAASQQDNVVLNDVSYLSDFRRTLAEEMLVQGARADLPARLVIDVNNLSVSQTRDDVAVGTYRLVNAQTGTVIAGPFAFESVVPENPTGVPRGGLARGLSAIADASPGLFRRSARTLAEVVGFELKRQIFGQSSV